MPTLVAALAAGPIDRRRRRAAATADLIPYKMIAIK